MYDDGENNLVIKYTVQVTLTIQENKALSNILLTFGFIPYLIPLAKYPLILCLE